MDFWLFSPDDILSKSSNLILYIYKTITGIATQTYGIKVVTRIVWLT
ncbi:hypothetical protein [Finegoldia magna]|nr:hypothetical protein [Finegoldia magna]MDU7164640.1 hypothetical protein [Finegoldia magna]